MTRRRITASLVLYYRASTRDGTRTHNLLLRREAPYPLGHTSCLARETRASQQIIKFFHWRARGGVLGVGCFGFGVCGWCGEGGGGLHPFQGAQSATCSVDETTSSGVGCAPGREEKGPPYVFPVFAASAVQTRAERGNAGSTLRTRGAPPILNSLLLAKRGHTGRWAKAPRMLGACVAKAPRTLWRAAPLRQLAKFAKAANDCTHRTSRSNERKAKDLLACAGACVWGSPLGPLRGISALAGNPKIYPFLGAFPRMPRGARDRAATL